MTAAFETDKTEHNPHNIEEKLPHAAQSDAAQDDKADAQDKHQWKRKEIISEGFKNKTKGEALFNKITYIGAGYGLVTATSVYMTWLLRDTKRIAPIFNKYAKAATAKFKLPESIANIMTLFAGGTLASVLPVKWLEDRKPELVKKFDRMLYTDEEYHSPEIQASHKELEEMPKQTWLSVTGSRVVAFGATLAAYFALGPNNSKFAKATGHSIDSVAAQLGRKTDRLINHNNPEAIAQIERAIETNVKRIALTKQNVLTGDSAVHGLEIVRDKEAGDRLATRVYNYIGMDAIYCAVTSALLFVGTRVFGGIFAKKQTEKAAMLTPSAPTSNATSNDTDASSTPTKILQSSNAPQATISHPIHFDRVVKPAVAAELTA